VILLTPIFNHEFKRNREKRERKNIRRVDKDLRGIQLPFWNHWSMWEGVGKGRRESQKPEEGPKNN